MSQRQFWKGHSTQDDFRRENIGTRPVDGDPARLAQAMQHSEKLVAAAIEYDPRLAMRAQWRRKDEGEHGCPELLAEGDDQPFYKRTRNVINEATAAGEPLRVVISTDDKEVPAGTAAAFIATARLVQQFIPLEIWWQGAWLNEHRTKGFVSLVPLIKGDMDFSRLEFCIADPWRDRFSFEVMASHAVLKLKEVWNGCGHRATDHYLRNSGPGANRRDRLKASFVAHTGIRPDAESIANHATEWLGWEGAYMENWHLQTNATAAAQSLPPLPVEYKDSRTPAEKLRAEREWEERWDREQRRSEREAAARLNHNE